MSTAYSISFLADRKVCLSQDDRRDCESMMLLLISLERCSVPLNTIDILLNVCLHSW